MTEGVVTHSKRDYLETNFELIKAKVLKGKSIMEISRSLDVSNTTLRGFIYKFPELKEKSLQNGESARKATAKSLRIRNVGSQWDDRMVR